MSSLDSVLRVRRHELSQRQAVLAQAIAADQELAAQQERHTQTAGQMSAQVAERTAGGPVDVAAISARLLYAGQMRATAQAVQRQRELVAQQIGVCRRAVARADADVKAVEQILEKRALAAAKARAKREQLAAEDQWQAGQLIAAGQSDEADETLARRTA